MQGLGQDGVARLWSVRTTLRAWMRFEPRAVRAARPTPIPSIRATVTPAEATPKAFLPSASTAALDRAVTVNPKPRPKTDRPPTNTSSPVCAVALSSQQQATDFRQQPTEADRDHPHRSDEEARAQGADRHGTGQAAQDQLLLGRTRVTDAIDKDRPADDRGRQRISGQQAEQDGAGEGAVAEVAQVDERVAARQSERCRDEGAR